MKNLVSILVLVFVITFTTQAQKKGGHDKPQFTIKQETNLAIKKMTLALDLSEKQQNEIKPFLMQKISERKAKKEKRKATKEYKKRPTVDQVYAMKMEHLNNQILIKNKMKSILNKEQFEKFEKMQKGRKRMALNKMKGKKRSKKNKGDKTFERPQKEK